MHIKIFAENVAAAIRISSLAIIWDAWKLSFIQNVFFVVLVVSQLLNTRYILVLAVAFIFPTPQPFAKYETRK